MQEFTKLSDKSRSELEEAVIDYQTRVMFLIKMYNLHDEEGCFTFPDGDTWKVPVGDGGWTMRDDDAS